MKWFRFYDEVLDDPKCQRLSAQMFKHWVNILCIANRSNERGTLPELEHIAFSLRLSEARTKLVIDALIDAELLDRRHDNLLSPHGWVTRQRVSDDVAQRVTKHRERNTPEPLQKQDCNVTETLPHARATETETETEPPQPPEGADGDGGDLPATSRLDQRWERFWAAYPRHEGTGAAAKAFRKIKPDDELTDRMIAAVEAAKRSEQWTRENGRFIPHAATWLNQTRWRDDPSPIGHLAGPPGVELLPGEKPEMVGPGAWDLVGRNGRIRRIRPDYHGVVYDSEHHTYQGLQDFYEQVNAAKEATNGHAHGGR